MGIRGVVIAASLTLLAMVGSPLLVLWWPPTRPSLPLPPLAEGLPPAFADADRAFRARIVTTFPVASPEADLIRAVEAQSFERQTGPDGNRSATFEQPRFPCRLVWQIDWLADNDARISRIEARYQESCL